MTFSHFLCEKTDHFVSLFSAVNEDIKNGKDSGNRIDLDQYKLNLNLHERRALTFHFDTPSSRRFYLCVIALVVERMKQNGRMVSIPMEDHAEI